MPQPLLSERGAYGILMPILGALMCAAFMPRVAVLNTTSLSERFIAQSLSVSGSDRTGPIEILIDEWSSDAELVRLRDALQKADTEKVLELLHQQKRRVGVVLLPGVAG